MFKPDTIPSDVVFWTGAGISAGIPSNLPLGDSLTCDVVNKFCISETWEKLLDYYNRTQMTDSYGGRKWSPRLESVVESLMGVYGLLVLEVLNGCYNAEPTGVTGSKSIPQLSLADKLLQVFGDHLPETIRVGITNQIRGGFWACSHVVGSICPTQICVRSLCKSV